MTGGQTAKLARKNITLCRHLPGTVDGEGIPEDRIAMAQELGCRDVRLLGHSCPREGLVRDARPTARGPSVRAPALASITTIMRSGKSALTLA